MYKKDLHVLVVIIKIIKAVFWRIENKRFLNMQKKITVNRVVVGV
jgi:hypothetical protein